MAAKADGQIWMKGRPACGLGSVVAVTNARNRLLPTKKSLCTPRRRDDGKSPAAPCIWSSLPSRQKRAS